MKVLLVDDHQMVSEGMGALLQSDPEVTETRYAKDGLEALKVAQEYRPDVVCMDLTMPGMNGLEATRQITQLRPAPQVVIVSMHNDPEFVAEALRAGAIGYVVKQSAAEELLRAVKTAAQGKAFLSPVVAGTVVEKYITNPADIAPRYTLLSPRERQTLQMLAEGLAVKEIAFKLGLSDKTVHAFRASLMDKLEIDNIALLTKYAIRHGLTTLD
jgi:DNA-binding NarL/FixJ family response regulator